MRVLRLGTAVTVLWGCGAGGGVHAHPVYAGGEDNGVRIMSHAHTDFHSVPGAPAGGKVRTYQDFEAHGDLDAKGALTHKGKAVATLDDVASLVKEELAEVMAELAEVKAELPSSEPCVANNTLEVSYAGGVGWLCECTEGYTGERCEVTIEVSCVQEHTTNVAWSPLLDKATGTAVWPRNWTHACECLRGFEGPTCNITRKTLMSTCEVAWCELSQAPLQVSIFSYVIGLHEDALYISGGTGPFGTGASIFPDAIADLKRFDLFTGEWTALQDAPVKVWGAAGCFVDGLFYVAGGYRHSVGGAISDMYAYDPLTDKWTQKKSMTAARFAFGIAGHRGYLYAFTGEEPGNKYGGSGVVDRYNPSVDTWESLATGTPRQHYAYAVLNGDFYLMGGHNDNWSWRDWFEKYNFEANEFTVLPPLPAPCHATAAFAVNGTLYSFGGGQNKPDVYSPAVWAYDGNAWDTSSTPALPAAYRGAHMRAVTLDGVALTLTGGEWTSGSSGSYIVAFNPELLSS